MIAGNVSVRLHRSPGALSELRPAWQRLFEVAREPVPFAHPAWAEAWWSVYGRGRELAVLEVRERDETVLLAPLQVSVVPGTGLRRLEFVGGAPTTFHDWMRNPRGLGLASSNDVLVRPGSERLVAAALAACIEGLHDQIDSVRLTAVPATSPLLGAPHVLGARWAAAMAPDTGRRFRLDLSRGWDEFRARLSKRQKKDLRYKVNQLERAAGASLELEVREDGPEVATALEAFMDLHLRRWHARGKPGLLPGEDRLYRALVSARAPLVVFRLLAGRRLIASQFGLRAGRRYAPYNFAFDPALREQSPSHVLMQLVIQESCERGLAAIELVPPAMARHWQPLDLPMYELRFTNQARVRRARAHLTDRLEDAIVSAQANRLGAAARSWAAARAA